MFLVLTNFSRPWKSCVKEQWPNKSLFQFFWLNAMISYLRPNRGWNIFESLKSWQMTVSANDKQSWVCIQFLVNKSRDKTVISKSWTFETNYTQNLHWFPLWMKGSLANRFIWFLGGIGLKSSGSYIQTMIYPSSLSTGGRSRRLVVQWHGLAPTFPFRCVQGDEGLWLRPGTGVVQSWGASLLGGGPCLGVVLAWGGCCLGAGLPRGLWCCHFQATGGWY